MCSDWIADYENIQNFDFIMICSVRIQNSFGPGPDPIFVSPDRGHKNEGRATQKILAAIAAHYRWKKPASGKNRPLSKCRALHNVENSPLLKNSPLLCLWEESYKSNRTCSNIKVLGMDQFYQIKGENQYAQLNNRAIRLRFIRPQRKGIFVEVRLVFVRAHSTKIQVFVLIDRNTINEKICGLIVIRAYRIGTFLTFNIDYINLLILTPEAYSF